MSRPIGGGQIRGIEVMIEGGKLMLSSFQYRLFHPSKMAPMRLVNTNVLTQAALWFAKSIEHVVTCNKSKDWYKYAEYITESILRY